MKRSISILNAALVLASLIIVCPSCKKEPNNNEPEKTEPEKTEPEKQDPQLTLLSENTTLQFNAGNDQNEKIQFSSNQDWTVSCSEDWLHIQPLSGAASDNNEITLSCDSNEGDEDRSAEVTITVEGLTKVISVKQLRSLTFYLSVQHISLYNPYILLNGDAQTIEVPVITNFEYSVNIQAPWIRPAETKGTTTERPSFCVADNPGPAGRSGIIEFSVNYANQATVTRTLTIYQLGSASETPEAVDLGLSVKWASFNVGATRPEEPGSLFAWGETAPKDEYTEANYKWLGPDGLTKYCDNEKLGTVDSKMNLDREDDAAYVAYGDGWHMPTVDQTVELVDDTSWYSAAVNGLNGVIFIAEKEGYENNWIFLPLVPASDDPLGRTYYWTSSILRQNAPTHANTIDIGGGINMYWPNPRYLGRPIRAVKDK